MIAAAITAAATAARCSLCGKLHYNVSLCRCYYCYCLAREVETFAFGAGLRLLEFRRDGSKSWNSSDSTASYAEAVSGFCYSPVDRPVKQQNQVFSESAIFFVELPRKGLLSGHRLVPVLVPFRIGTLDLLQMLLDPHLPSKSYTIAPTSRALALESQPFPAFSVTVAAVILPAWQLLRSDSQHAPCTL